MVYLNFVSPQPAPLVNNNIVYIEFMLSRIVDHLACVKLVQY